MKRKIWLGVIAVPVLLGGTMASAPAAPLNVKTGLWETTFQAEMRGQLPIPPDMLQQLSPDRRAAMENIMKDMTDKPYTRVHKNCVTQQDLDKGDSAFLADRPGMKCSNKLTQHTGSAVAGTFECTTGGMRQTGDFAFEAKDREHLAGKVNINISDGAKAMTSHANMSARWLSASCGATH